MASNSFYGKPFGFRKKAGTHSATCELLNQLLLDIDTAKAASALFLDLMEALIMNFSLKN